MNKHPISLVLLTLIPIINFAQSDASKKINKLMKEQEMAWNQGDIEGFMAAYWNSDSLLFVGGSGPQYGWKTTLERYKKAYPSKEKMGKLIFDNLRQEEVGKESIQVLGKWVLERESDTLKGYYTLLWKQIEGEWKIVYDHSSSIKN